MPAAQLVWSVDGRAMEAGIRGVEAADGGLEAISELELTGETLSGDEVKVECKATHPALPTGDALTYVHTLRILRK